MNYVDLFTGIGGFALAASLVWGNEFNPVMFCEIDKFCQKVLKKHWPHVPIIEDIKDEQAIADATVPRQFERRSETSWEVRHKTWREEFERRNCCRIDLLCGGPPCQPASCAGLRKGKADPRFLWPQALRAVEIAQPRWVIFENPTGFLSLNGGMEYESVVYRLEGAGYWVESFIIPASAVGAWHRRDRVWIVANNEIQSERRTGLCEGFEGRKRRERSGNGTCVDSNPDGSLCNRGTDEPQWETEERIAAGRAHCNHYCEGPSLREMQSGNLREELAPAIGDHLAMHWLQAVEQFCGVVHGVSTRVDRHRRKRIKALGNSIVPQVAIRIMRAIQAADYAEKA